MTIILSEKHFDLLDGGLADKKTPSDIAKHHNVALSAVQQQIKKGIKVEMEHTNNKNVALEICLDHLMEDPKYYDKLETIEND